VGYKTVRLKQRAEEREYNGTIPEEPLLLYDLSE
jgi:hypothetical protein